MRRMPSTMALQAFCAAARSLSFQNAAEELNVTPGAISRQIQGLEEELGVALFHRHHRRVELSEAGRRFVGEIGAPLEQIAAAVRRQHGRPADEPLSIVAYPTFAIRWFIPRWGRFHDRHPGIDVRLATSLNPADFSSGQHDVALAIRQDGAPDPRLAIHDLVDIELFPVCSPAVAARLTSPAELAGETLLHGAPRPLDWPRWLEAAGVGGIDPAKGQRFETLTLAYQAAIEGLGVAIGIAAFIADDLASGRLVRPFAFARRSGHPMQLLYPRAGEADPRLVAFRDWLLAEAAA